MLKVSDAFNSAFAAPDRELHARVTIGKTVYDSDDLTSINYDSGAMTGEQFSIGSTYMNSTKITFSHLVEGLKQLDEVLVEFGVLKPDGAVEYVKMGTFIVDDKIQMDRNNNTTTIECMDRMTMLGGAYVSKLTYPARIKDVAVEIANMAGVKSNETSFARLSENKINQPTGYTYRDAIGLIAQFQMGFALFDRDGLLDIRTLQDNSFKIDPNQYFLKGLVKNETFFKLNGISCTVVTTSKDENGNETSKTTVLQSGSSSGAQIKLANNVMTQDVLDRMYEALKFTNYYPFSLNWNGNPAVEAGDWLTVEDLQGNEFKVPNMSYTLTYNGGLTATSKADTSVSSPATYSYGGTISNIVNEIGGRESAEGNHIYEGTEDQEPTLSKEGDLWYKHVGPDTEERIYKDGKWEFLTSTKTANDAADAADKASKEAEEAKNQANKAVDGANDAVAKAGFANDTATQAKSDAASALQKALDAYNHGDQIKTGLTADIDAVKGQVNLKANQVDVDKLGGRVTDAEAQIKLQADQIKLTVSKTELTNVLGDYATQTWTQSQIKVTADGINSTLSSVQTQVQNSAVGTNLLTNTGDLTANWYGAAFSTTTEYDGHPSMAFTSSTQQLASQYLNLGKLQNSTRYTASFWAKADNAGDKAHTELWGSINAADFVLTTNWVRYTAVITSSSDAKTNIGQSNYYLGVPTGNTGNVYIALPKLEKGSLATDWCPNPADNVSVAAFSKLSQTVNGVQVTANNAVTQAQFTLLSNQFTSVIGDPDNLIIGGGFEDQRDYIGQASPYWSGLHTVAVNADTSIGNNPSATVLQIPGLLTGNNDVTGRNLIAVSPAEYKFSLKLRWASPTQLGTILIYAFECDANKALIAPKVIAQDTTPNGWHTVTGTYTPSSDKVRYIKFDVTYAGAQGTTPIYVDDIHMGLNVATQSQFTQLKDDINLRVEKGDVVNQINISPEGILIDGKKVHITGQTSIDNAVIKDAMIADIKADKITAGTLNAANVNVINLNAANITTGTLKGTNLSMNLNTGEVVFQHGRIHSASDNVDVNIDQGYLSTASSDTRVMLKEGQLQLVQPTIFDNSKDPYLEISNSVGGASFNGANIIARDYLVLANRTNSDAFFDAPLDKPETFAGLAVGKSSSGQWKPTRIGGAERGIVMRGGTAYKIDSSFMYKHSPEIFVGTDEAGLNPSDRIYINGSFVHIKSAYWRTASGSANLMVAQDGALVRSTSASKYKTDIIRTNIPDYGEKLLELPTATWTDIAETKRYRDNPTTQPEPTRNFGMIAEDLADAGLEMLVVRGTDGELEGINYDRIGPALIPVIAKLKNEVETLKQQLEAETA